MRFLLKIGFWVALVAFFLPSQGGENGAEGGIDPLGALLGTQQALSDASGFCDRAPLACQTGRDVGSFVASRVGDGLAYGYAVVRSRTVEEEREPPAIEPAPPSRPEVASAPAAKPDPMQTAAVAAERVRQAPNLEPFAMPARVSPADRARTPLPARFVPGGTGSAIPTPTPRP